MTDQVATSVESSANRTAVPAFADPMIRDLFLVALVPLNEIESLARAIAAEENPFTADSFSAIVAEHVSEESCATAVANLTFFLGPEQLDGLFGHLESWRAESPANNAKFPDRALADLRTRLPLLIRRYPALNRCRKAQLLRGGTGALVDGIDILCDARPIFDEAREKIEGFVPLITLRLAYKRQNQQSEVAEFLISVDALKTLIEKSQTADKKLKVLCDSISGWLPNGLA